MERLAGKIILLGGWRRSLAAFLAGAFAVFALAPFDFFAACLVSFPVLVWLLDGAAGEPGAGPVGRLVPAYCSSSGQALLIDHTREQLHELFGGVRFVRLGPSTPRSLADLTKRIEVARERGYATVDEEFEPGLVAAAAPVRDFRGRIVAALNVSGPKFRFGERLDEAGAEAAAAARTLGERLGWTPQRPHATLRA